MQGVKDLRKAMRDLEKERRGITPDPTKIAAHEAKIDTLARQLAADVKPEWSSQSADRWHERIQVGDENDFETRGPTGNFTKERTLPPEADRLLEPFYVKDPVAALAIYSRNSARKREFLTRFGQAIGGVKDLNQVLDGKGMKDAIAADPARFNTNTPEGRANIIRDLTDVRTANRQEMLLREAVRHGMIEEDVRTLRDLSERITGRQFTAIPSQIRRLISWASALGSLSLMPRVMWASVSEPVNVYFHTRDVGLMLKTFAGNFLYSPTINGTALGTAATKDTGTTAGKIPVLDGSARYPQADGSQITNLLRAPDLIAEEQYPDGTNGPSSSSASWHTRVLNTVVRNVISGASLASSTVTLPAGTYYAAWSAPACQAANHKTSLYNSTASSNIGVGTMEYCAGSDITQTNSLGGAFFTLAGSANIILRHFIRTGATNGLGHISGDASGFPVVLARLEIWKVG